MHKTISFSEIPEHGIQLEIKNKSWFPEEQVKSAGPAAAVLFLAKKGESRIEIRGQLEADVGLFCDRCLAEFTHAVNAAIHLIVEVNDPGDHWRVQDMDGTDADVETIQVDAPKVDIGAILREQVYLALPEKKLCSKICKGLCPQCGENLNSGNCTCMPDVVNSPFGVLAKLKKNN